MDSRVNNGFRASFSPISRIFWEITHTSKLYRGVMLITTLIYLIYSISMLSVLDLSTEHIRQFVVDEIRNTTLLAVCCHVLVRTYLRINILNFRLTTRRVVLLVGYLFFVSFIYSATLYIFYKLGWSAGADIAEILFSGVDGEIKGSFKEINIYILVFINILFTLILWSVGYLLWHFYNKKRRLQQQIDQAKIQQLTNQLSPHFLFNSLNSIRALVYADQDQAAELITLLSDLLRTQMQSQMKTRSTLEADWAIASKYLSIEKVRFEDRVQLTVDFEEATLQQAIPTLTLLTLTENAMKHGIFPSSQKGEIRVSSRLINRECWHLEVENTVFNSSSEAGTQVGQHHVRKRLELMFGDHCRFDIHQTRKSYKVIMEMPYVKRFNC